MNKHKGLRLIAIRPLESCDSQYLKNLQKGTFYFFYEDYEENKEKNGIKKKTADTNSNLSINPTNFYQLNDTKLNISVSAIIGKNGSGKSTIVELVIRILNNFAYAAGFDKVQNSIHPVNGLYAELYYEINSKPFKIEINNKLCKWEDQDISELDKETMLKISLQSDFFYTQVSNYSLYAYNSLELENESDGDWITGIFHKNDGYQTPIVLNPMRTEGMIDINKENGLTKDRLISLFLTKDTSSSSFRRINDKQIAVLFEVKPFSERTKLQQTTLLGFFRDYREKWRTDYILNSKIKRSNTFEILKNDLSQLKQILDDHKKTLPNDNIVNREGLSFLRNLKNISEMFTKEQFLYFWNKALEQYSDLGSLNMSIISPVELITKIHQAKNSSFSSEYSVDEIIVFFTTPPVSLNSLDSDPEEEHNQYINPVHLQRIITITLCSKIWTGILELGKSLDDIEERLRDYIIYKTLSIISKYPNYETDRKKIFTEFDIFENKQAYETLEADLEEAINKIYKEDICSEKTHITLKIRQCINYLNEEHPYRSLDFSRDKSKYISITEYSKQIEEYSKAKKKEKLTDIFSTYEYFLPPIFDTDIVLEHLNGNEDISSQFEGSNKPTFIDIDSEWLNEDDQKQKVLAKMSRLSSGERQQLNAISSVIYHLRNISSASGKNTHLVKYEYVNLFFEEIELYFHPEYQRTFLSTLLNHLSKANLDIRGINLCFITHSPFILSDIPRQNILALEGGKPHPMPFDTLGANIHEMLGHSFLLQNTIGEIVKDKINMFLEEYNNYKTYKEEYDRCRGNKEEYDWTQFSTNKESFAFLISNMGKGYLRNVLQGYYQEIIKGKDMPKTLEERIEKKKQEKKEIERELEALKQEQNEQHNDTN